MYHLINVFETHIILFENFTLSAIHHEGYDKQLVRQRALLSRISNPLIRSDQIRFHAMEVIGLLEIHECDQGITTLRISAGFVILHILWGWKIGKLVCTRETTFTAIQGTDFILPKQQIRYIGKLESHSSRVWGGSPDSMDKSNQ